jgi:sugar phosphate isomerase/epimerase
VRLGVCGRKFPDAQRLGPEGVLDRAHELGFEGVFFRTILDLDPTLEPAHLESIRRRAADYDLYLEVGLGKVNPFNLPETPEVRALGAGDTRLGMERMIGAAHAMGCTELWADTANSQQSSWGLFAIDRFRTDVTWDEQLRATSRFLRSLAPLLNELGCRINLETHEEITTRELLGLVDAVGADALGVTLDLANVVLRGENPLAATRRVAPYVHLTHMRDVILYQTPGGLARQIRCCGDGIIDWAQVLSILADSNPRLNLTVENVDRRKDTAIPFSDPRWRATDPNLSDDELQQLLSAADDAADQMQRGELPTPDAYYPDRTLTAEEQIEFIRRCHRHLRRAAQKVPASRATVHEES